MSVGAWRMGILSCLLIGASACASEGSSQGVDIQDSGSLMRIIDASDTPGVTGERACLQWCEEVGGKPEVCAQKCDPDAVTPEPEVWADAGPGQGPSDAADEPSPKKQCMQECIAAGNSKDECKAQCKGLPGGGGGGGG